MTKPKYFILASDHPNDAVLSVGEWMAGGLKAIGIDVSVLSIPRDIKRISCLFANDTAGIISLGPLPLNIKIDNNWYIWQKINCPVWIYLLDAIIYDVLRVPLMREYLKDAADNANLKIISPENGYFDFLKKKSQGGILPEGLIHIPFGHFANLNRSSLPKEDRICVIGTIGSELGLKNDINKLEEIIEIHGRNIIGSHEKRKLIELSDDDNLPAMPLKAVSDILNLESEKYFSIENLSLICAIDSYFKRLRRFKAIKSLSGLSIDFYGTGWRNYFSHEKNFRYLENIKHQEVALYIARYKGVINFDPNWEMGVHDRVFTACAMGVPIITNENSGLQKIDMPSRLIHTYSINNPQLKDIAEQLINDKENISAPQLKLISKHSWVNRMAQLISH